MTGKKGTEFRFEDYVTKGELTPPAVKNLRAEASDYLYLGVDLYGKIKFDRPPLDGAQPTGYLLEDNGSSVLFPSGLESTMTIATPPNREVSYSVRSVGAFVSEPATVDVYWEVPTGGEDVIFDVEWDSEAKLLNSFTILGLTDADGEPVNSQTNALFALYKKEIGKSWAIGTNGGLSLSDDGSATQDLYGQAADLEPNEPVIVVAWINHVPVALSAYPNGAPTIPDDL